MIRYFNSLYNTLCDKVYDGVRCISYKMNFLYISEMQTWLQIKKVFKK